MDTDSSIEKMPGLEMIKPLPVIPSAPKEPDAAEWSIEKVVEYLEKEGFKEQAENFREEVCSSCIFGRNRVENGS